MVRFITNLRHEARRQRQQHRISRSSLAFVLMAAMSPGLVGQDGGPSPESAPSLQGKDQKPAAAKGTVVSQLDKAVMRVFQARNNDYWFASKDRGVYRFDGKTLVNFTTDDGLCHNDVGGIQEDKAGNIYFTTTSAFDADRRRYTQGISRFDGETFATMDIPENGTSDDSWKLEPDDLWFGGGQDSGVVYRYDGASFHRLELPRTKEGDAFLEQHPRTKYPNIKFSPYDTYVIFKDSKGHIWFGTAILGTCRYDGKSFAWIPDRDLRNGSFGTRSIIEDKDGGFWFCDSKYRYFVDLSDASGLGFRKEAGVRDSDDPDRPRIEGIMSSVIDHTGALWMATYGDGVWRYDGKDVAHYPVRSGDEDVHLFMIHKDNHGTLWLGTQSSGVYRFNGKTFELFRP